MMVQIEPATGFVLLDGASWDYYSRTLGELGPSRGTRVTFDHGKMEIRKTSALHQRKRHVIARLLETYATDADIAMDGFGTLTLRREDLQTGLEPDECYYVRNPRPALTARELDFKVQPLPDLGIDVEVLHAPIQRLPLYAQLGLKEVWRCVGYSIEIFRLSRTAGYKATSKSVAFPNLDLVGFNRLVSLAFAVDEHTAVNAMRELVQFN